MWQSEEIRDQPQVLHLRLAHEHRVAESMDVFTPLPALKDAELPIRQARDDRAVLGHELLKLFVPRCLLFGHGTPISILFEVVQAVFFYGPLEDEDLRVFRIPTIDLCLDFGQTFSTSLAEG